MIGEPVEYSLWFSGDSADQKRKAEILIRSKFEQSAWTYGLIQFETLKPEDDRVPVPPSLFDQENPMLLLGFAEIIDTPQIDSKLSDDLEDEDLESLRAATRKVARRPLTDVECDEFIDHYGPETALRVVH